MTERSTSRYAGNANQAAALAPGCMARGCPSCVKSGLPVLLVRPGLANREYADKNAAQRSALWPDVADIPLSYFAYVARTLRKGYVYAYYEKAHTAELMAQDGWQCFQVDDLGYLTPFPLAVLPTPGDAVEFACERSAGYASAMLFVIPEPHRTGTVWVAYSDTPWSDKVRERYAGNSLLRQKRMSNIHARQAQSDRSLPLTQATLTAIVTDYDTDRGRAFYALKGNPHPPGRMREREGPDGSLLQKIEPRVETASDLIEQLSVITEQAHPISEKNALIVSVPDAVGITHEGAVLRSTLPQAVLRLTDTPQGYWKLQSAYSLEATIQLFEQQYQELGSFYLGTGDPNRYMQRSQYDYMMAQGLLPPSAQFVAYSVSGSIGSYKITGANVPGIGSVYIPEDDRPATQIRKEVGQGPSQFLQRYEQACEQDQRLLSKVEKDYGAWLCSDARRFVTEHDFDDTERFDGVSYGWVVSKVCFGGPMTDIGTEWYKDLLNTDPYDPKSIVTRALLGNQSDFFQWFADRDQQGKLVTEIKAIYDLAAELQEQVESGKKLPALVGSLAALKQLTGRVAAAIVDISGATALKLAQLKAAPPALLSRVEQALLRVSVVSAGGTSQVRVTRVSANAYDAQMYWREVVKNNEAAQVHKKGNAGRQEKVVSVVRGGTLALDISSPGGAAMTDVYIFEKVTAAASVVTTQRLPTALPQLKWWAEHTAGVLTNGGFLINTVSAWLQLFSLERSLRQAQEGSLGQRTEAVVGILSTSLGTTAALMEMATVMLAMEDARAVRWQMFAARMVAVGTGFEAALAFGKAFETRAGGNIASSNAYLIQGAAYSGAAIAYLNVARTFGAISRTRWLFGLSWTGWGLLLVALGIGAGYLAKWLTPAPAQDWARRTIWGQGRRWTNLEQEQAELNKLMLGVSVEFSYRNGLGHTLLRSAAAVGMGWLVTEPGNPLDYREVALTLRLPDALRDRLAWTIQIYGVDQSAVSTLLLERGNASAEQRAGGVTYSEIEPQRLSYRDDAGDEVKLSMEIDAKRYRDAYAQVRLATQDDSVILSERLP